MSILKNYTHRGGDGQIAVTKWSMCMCLQALLVDLLTGLGFLQPGRFNNNAFAPAVYKILL